MSQPAETWYTLAIADSPSLRMLLADIRDHVRRARLSRRLDREARIYAVIGPESVRLWVNRSALEALDVFRRVPLRAGDAPAAHECVNSLIDNGTSSQSEFIQGPFAASLVPASASSR